ncbi:hypothetical protein [Pseudomonas sp. B16120]|uniref:hypothetical protein n=1 Tax=Pseudomonas sp. B16120 TaxID=3235108 RepID=UPI003782FE16
MSGLKAYSVQGNEYGVVTFALSGVVARREGANELNIEFGQVESCRRMPGLDDFAGQPGGVPMRLLVEEHGWSQECGYCERRVYHDQPERVWEDDQVFCSAEHQAKGADYRANILGEQV